MKIRLAMYSVLTPVVIAGAVAATHVWVEDEVAVPCEGAAGPAFGLFRHDVLADGATLSASVLFDDGVLEGQAARPVSVELLFLWNEGLMGNIHVLKEAPLASDDPLTFDIQGLSSEVHDASSDPAPRSYSVVLEPAEGFVWGTLQSPEQVVIDVSVGA